MTSMLSASAASELADTNENLVEEIRKIGLARFVGRINAGVIDASAGYSAVERFNLDERRRPLVSRLTHIFIGREDPYRHDCDPD